MSSSLNVTLFGDASAVQIAIWVCGVVLVTLLGGIIAKSKRPRDLRFLTCCVLVSVFAILGFAYVSSHDGSAASENNLKPAAPNKPQTPAVSGGDTQAPITDQTRNEYLGKPLDKPPQSANPPQLQSPARKTRGAGRSNGSWKHPRPNAADR